jgi:small conductance mechanosensitive channel
MGKQYFEKITENFIEFITLYGMKIIGAIIVLIIGWWIIKIITNAMSKIFEKRKIDASLVSFFKSLIAITLKLLLIISVLGMMGIQMTSFIAIIGAAGLAVGMALSGTLQNFAGGVIILLFRPFNVGDFIDTQGFAGTVNEIGIFTTILKTPDNKVVIIPNGKLSSASLTNITREKTRRVDWVFGIGYGDSAKKAKEAFLTFIKEDERIFTDPVPFIALKELGDSSVNFVVRVWVNASDYWGVYFDMNEKVYERFSEFGLNIPFPQMDVHIHNN